MRVASMGLPLSLHRLQVEDSGGQIRREDRPQRHTRSNTRAQCQHTLSVCVFSHNGQQHRDVIRLPSCKSEEFINVHAHYHKHLHLQHMYLVFRRQHLHCTHLLHSGHCHRQTVQKETCSWGRRPGHELALQCSVQSAECCHSWCSENSIKSITS